MGGKQHLAGSSFCPTLKAEKIWDDAELQAATVWSITTTKNRQSIHRLTGVRHCAGSSHKQPFVSSPLKKGSRSLSQVGGNFRKLHPSRKTKYFLGTTNWEPFSSPPANGKLEELILVIHVELLQSGPWKPALHFGLRQKIVLLWNLPPAKALEKLKARRKSFCPWVLSEGDPGWGPARWPGLIGTAHKMPSTQSLLRESHP